MGSLSVMVPSAQGPPQLACHAMTGTEEHEDAIRDHTYVKEHACRHALASAQPLKGCQQAYDTAKPAPLSLLKLGMGGDMPFSACSWANSPCETAGASGDTCPA